MARLSKSQIKQKIRQAQQKVQREVNKVQRENKRKVEKYNREIKRTVNQINQAEKEYNRRADSHNRKVISALTRTRLTKIQYTESEQRLVDKIYDVVRKHDTREYDIFLSYTHIDGAEIAQKLRDTLESLEVSVWFDKFAISPGQSQSLQMDAGLQKAKAGIILLTPEYLTGRFWTERELGALLRKDILIPILHDVTFEDVEKYSGILPDLAGFTTKQDTIDDIAKKIAALFILREE